MTNLRTPVGKWATETEVHDRLAKMRGIREQHQNLLTGLHEAMSQKRSELESSLGALTDAERHSVTSRALASHKRDILQSSDASRTELQRNAVRHADEMRSVEGHYRSPMQ